jgi:hypothetical protein
MLLEPGEECMRDGISTGWERRLCWVAIFNSYGPGPPPCGGRKDQFNIQVNEIFSSNKFIIS